MRLFPLERKAFILKGNPTQFLSGLTSNTLDAPHNAFLNMHGRIIATFEQLRLSDEEFLIVIAVKAETPLKEHIDRYLKLNLSTLNETQLNVYFDVDGNAPLTQADHVIAERKGRLLITPTEYKATMNVNEFTLFRLENNIPLHGIDYTDEMLLNIDEYLYISYTKGCFLGQEMVAKVHNRSKPSWVLKVKYHNEVSETEQSKMTSTVLDPKTNRVLGFIFLPNA